MRALGKPKAVCVRFCKRAKSRGGKCVRKRKQNAFPFVRQDQKMDAPLCAKVVDTQARGRCVDGSVGGWATVAHPESHLSQASSITSCHAGLCTRPSFFCYHGQPSTSSCARHGLWPEPPERPEQRGLLRTPLLVAGPLAKGWRRRFDISDLASFGFASQQDSHGLWPGDGGEGGAAAHDDDRIAAWCRLCRVCLRVSA